METETVEKCADAKPSSESQTTQAGGDQATPTRRSDGLSRFPRIMIIASIVAALAAVVAVASSRILSKTATPPTSTEETAATPDADASSVTLDASQIGSIKLATATSRAFRGEKLTTGRIAFNEEFLTPVFSPYTGRVIRLLAKPGDVIKQGSPLFEIDTPDLVQAESDLITAVMSVAKSNAALELARRTEDRQHRLYVNKAVALKDWEQSESDVRNAERDVRSAEATLAAARARLRVFGKTETETARIESERQVDRVTRVLSPIAGTITARKVGPGQYVKPDNPDPLFTVADLSTIWILADVYESDVPLFKIGQPVEVCVPAYPNEVFTARISYINPTVDSTTHRVAVRGVIENRQRRLKPDMFASLRIVTHSDLRSLFVPSSSIIHEGDRAGVWVAQAGNLFVKREVRVGLEQDGYTQVITGLQAGETVATEGSLLLANASRIQD